jgi:ABC-type antimicrobial peptide transport system permease subunit
VAGNVKEIGLNEVEFAGIYVPFAQMPAPRVELVVRAGVPAGSLAGELRAVAATVDPGVPVLRVSTFDERVEDALRGDRFNLALIASFATVALLLAAIGIYGSVAYAVQARRREFGVRLTLGARPARLIGSALAESVRLAVFGGLAGLGAVFVIARLAGDALYLVRGEHTGVLYEVSMTDPAALGTAVAVMLAVVLAAAVVPARRVASVDPVQALRTD